MSKPRPLTYKQLCRIRRYLNRYIPVVGNKYDVEIFNKIQAMIRETPEYKKQLNTN